MIGTNNRQYLDPHQAFTLWIEYGSLPRVRDQLMLLGVKNPTSGTVPSRGGIYSAAWQYILFNLDEAKKEVSGAWRTSGRIMTDDDWGTMVIKAARYHLRGRRFQQFIKEHPEFARYHNEQIAARARAR